MQAPPPQPHVSGGKQPPIWLPPVQVDWFIAVVLVILGSNIETVPDEWRVTIATPLTVFVGMMMSAGLAAMGLIPVAFAMAFFLVNLVRIMPKKKVVRKASPGVKEGFVPSGTMDWVTTNKKWFVEKVLMERPIAIQEKEVSTYPVSG